MKRFFALVTVTLLVLQCVTFAPAFGDEETPAASAIMEQPLDGSNEEAFRASLAKVKAEATPDEYRYFNSVIGRMMTYDLTIRYDVGKLAAKVDGKTPAEVIAMAEERW